MFANCPLRGDKMKEIFSRTELLIGSKGLSKLNKSKVAIFGIGGVGSYTAEALVRSGVGKLVMVDHDLVSISNINRQLPATMETIGQAKVECMKKRLLTINPKCDIITFKNLYLPEVAHEFLADDYDYIVDAVDMVTAKIDLVVQAQKRNIPIISAMGAGNKMDPSQFEVADIYETSVCPLAKVMRKELRARNIPSLKVVYSREQPMKVFVDGDGSRKRAPGSISFVPSVSGLIIAGEVIKDLIADENKKQI